MTPLEVSVMMSIKPKYCELIASGNKTIEVRKTKPKIEIPFRAFIYCTKKYDKHGDGYFQGKYCGKVIGEFACDNINEIHVLTDLIWEHDINDFSERTLNILNKSCLSCNEIINYSECSFDNYNPKKEYLYGWHISDLKIYDKPKELSEFMIVDKSKLKECPYRERIYQNPDYCNGNYLLGGYSCNKIKEPDFNDIDFCRGGCLDVFKPLTRPPQSWCYVMEVD